MGRIIEAKAVISAEDRTGGAFDAIARKMKNVGKGAKVSAEIERMTRSLKGARDQLAAIDAYRTNRNGFFDARNRMRETKAAVEQASRALANAAKPTQQLRQNLRNAQIAADTATAAYERQKTAVLNSRSALVKNGIAVNGLIAEQNRLGKAVDQGTSALERRARIEHRNGERREVVRQLRAERQAVVALTEARKADAVQAEARKRASASGDMLSGMGGMGRRQSEQLRRDADKAAQSRRVAYGMGAPARQEQEARERARHEAEQQEIYRRATASGDLLAGMGGVGRREAERIAQSRRLTEGMSAPGREARAEADRLRQDHADEQAARYAERRADRRDAAGTLAAGASLYLGHKGKEIGLQAINAAADMDYAVRYQHVATDVSERDQQRLLIPQAKRIGQETKFSNRDIVEAQTATMQGLPFNDPAVKAQVGSAIVEQSRYYAVLFKAGMEEASQGIRAYLQNTNKDISTPEKAIAESQRATNLIVKTAKLGGMNNDDAQQYMKFGLPTATQAGFSDVTSMALGATARRSGLKGDEAGVFVRSAASKLISPTKEGREAEIMAGIDRSKYQKMPETLNAEAFERIGKGRFGVSFSDKQKQRLSSMFSDGDLVTNRENFIKQVSGVVSESFDKVQKGKNKGKLKAQDAAKIAKLASDFHRMSVESTDVEGLLNAHMNSPTFTAALRNKFYTDKHGGKAGILATHFDQFKNDREQLSQVTQTPDFARDKAMYMTKGVGGSIDNVKGSFETAVLNFGTKNADLIQGVADGIAKVGDGIADLPDKTVQAGTALAAVAASGASAASALAIVGKLTGSATLTALGTAGAAAMLPVVGGAAAAGFLYAASDESKGLVHGGRPDFQMNPSDELPGLEGSTSKPSWAPGPKVEPNRPSVADGVPSLIDAGLKNRSASIAKETASLAGYRKELEALRSEMSGLSDLGLPSLGAGQDKRTAELATHIRQAEEHLRALKPSAAPDLSGQVAPVQNTLDRATTASRAAADPSGQVAAINNTLDKATTASTTAANGGKPIEATVKPDQITAKIDSLPPVTGEANVNVQNQVNVAVTVNDAMLQAKVDAAAGRAAARVSLSSGGARPGAVSMPGAAAPPGAQ